MGWSTRATVNRHYVATQAFAVARPEHLRSSLRELHPDADATLAAFGALS